MTHAAAIYNENDPFAAQWLANLIRDGLIAPGRVDTRSIADLAPADVAGPGQRHYFGGIGGWSYALRLAGVPDNADVWTGSCPCQPFSDAGKRSGTRDPRHLWPAWFALIRECRPPTIFGEQVASRDGLAWLDLVRSDLERCGYAFGASDLCAAGVGAPHIRQRLYFVAYAREGGCPLIGAQRLHDHRQSGHDAARRREAGLVADHIGHGLEESAGPALGAAVRSGDSASTMGDPDRSRLARPEVGQERGGVGRLVTAEQARRLGDPRLDRAGQHDGELPRDEGEHDVGRADRDHAPVPPGTTGGFWANAEWIPCIDGVARPVEPGLEPLAHGIPGRVGLLRGYGNAIVPQVAALFIQVAEEARRDLTR